MNDTKEQKQKEQAMPLVKVVRNGQITIPKELRALLDIREGDYLEIDIKGGSIVVKPKIAIEKDPMRKKFFELVDEIRAEMKDADPDQVTKDIEEAIMAVRKEAAKKNKAKAKK